MGGKEEERMERVGGKGVWEEGESEDRQRKGRATGFGPKRCVNRGVSTEVHVERGSKSQGGGKTLVVVI